MKLTEAEGIIVRGQMEQRAQRIVLGRNKELGECAADRHTAGVLEIGEQRARRMRRVNLIGILAGQIAQTGRDNADFGVTHALQDEEGFICGRVEKLGHIGRSRCNRAGNIGFFFHNTGIFDHSAHALQLGQIVRNAAGTIEQVGARTVAGDD